MQLQKDIHLHTSCWLYTTGSLVTIGPSNTATATNIDNDEESVISMICDYEPIGLTYVLQWSRNQGGRGATGPPTPNNQAPCYSI